MSKVLKITLLIALLLLIAGGAVFFYFSNNEDPATVKLMTARYYGGLCADGPCESTSVFYLDGYVEHSNQGRKYYGDDKAKQLQETIEEADYEQLHDIADGGQCASAYDGTDVEVTFHASSGDQVFDTCTHRLNSKTPLFNAQSAVFEAANSQ